jgi:hypothetical protein
MSARRGATDGTDGTDLNSEFSSVPPVPSVAKILVPIRSNAHAYHDSGNFQGPFPVLACCARDGRTPGVGLLQVFLGEIADPAHRFESPLKSNAAMV